MVCGVGCCGGEWGCWCGGWDWVEIICVKVFGGRKSIFCICILR